MKVRDLQAELAKFSLEEDVIVLHESRMGHDDAVCGFSIEQGYLDSKNDEDVRLKQGKRYSVPCCVISI